MIVDFCEEFSPIDGMHAEVAVKFILVTACINYGCKVFIGYVGFISESLLKTVRYVRIY